MVNVTIDPSWEEIQEGLYLESYTRINSLTGQPMLMRILHSADGYCFYDKTDPYFDEEGNELPESQITPEMRMYYQWMSLAPNKDINDLVSVPVQPGYEIASTAPGVETA